MPKALGGAIGANKARDRLGTKNSNSDFYEDDTDSLDLAVLSVEELEADDPTRARQLEVINQIRGLIKSTEELSWLELLEHVGISEDEYLQYGAIWRDIAEADHSASLRQKDQFIFLDDLKDLCERTRHIFKIPNLDSDKIARLDIPVMSFHFGDKVHRLDVTKALLIEAVDQMMDLLNRDNELEKRKIYFQIEEHLKRRYPTRELMCQYEIYKSSLQPADVSTSRLA